MMQSLHSTVLAASLLGACLMFATAANAEPLTATGFFVGSQTITLTDPARNGNVPAGAFSLNPPADEIAYCIDLAQPISFGTLYTDYTKSSLAADGVLSSLRKGEVAQLFHGFYTTSLLNSTNSAGFQLALWEILFETGASLDVDSTHAATRGVNYATSPDTPGGVITTANAWLAGLGGFSTDTTGLFTYRSGEHQDQIVSHYVPEPPTWIIFCAGLGLVALLVRRRGTLSWHLPCSPVTCNDDHKGGNQVKNAFFRMAIVLVVTMTLSSIVRVGDSWALSSGTGSSGGSAGSSSGGSGGGAGGGGGAGSAGGDGGGGGGSSAAVGAAGPPGDAWVRETVQPVNFLASVGAFSFSQPAPAFRMTRAQERTWDTFRTCAPNGALIDQLRVDGSFTFQATLQSDVYAIKTCMTRIGYRFDY